LIVDYIDEHKGRFGVEPVCAVSKDADVQIAPARRFQWTSWVVRIALQRIISDRDCDPARPLPRR
jgi:hypothetical protein